MANYMIWRIMMNRVTNLPLKYRNIRNEYYKVRNHAHLSDLMQMNATQDMSQQNCNNKVLLIVSSRKFMGQTQRGRGGGTV